MSGLLARAVVLAVLAVAAAAAATSQSADEIICQQLRMLARVDLLGKSVDEYKTIEQMMGSVTERIGAEIEGCKATLRRAECAPDVLDKKAGEAEKLKREAKKLRELLQEIEQRLQDAGGKRRELEAKLRNKGSCRDGQ